ncbi:hypothetical protein [Neptunicella sp.]|uniref:hypothetical protein n=1 Tax=Neptunicella sp. TaxID=2125986 RepID=UPI003F68FC57
MTRKVLISYDLLTVKPSMGRQMVSRFDFVQTILERLGFDVVLETNREQYFPFDTICEDSHSGYLRTVTGVDKNSVESRLLLEHIQHFDIVICYELSDESFKLFQQLNIDVIDIWFSPIRFCADNMFTLRASNPEVQQKLSLFNIDEQVFYQQARKLSEHCQQFLPTEMKLSPNSALLIGQMLQDKAVMKGDKFITLQDYLDEIQTLAKQYSMLYLLKHPFMSDHDFSLIRQSLSSISNLVYLRQGNVYKLLACPEISAVIALSSSVLSEAVYFGKQVHYLFRNLFVQGFITVQDAFFSSDFWAALLKCDNPIAGVSYLHCDNFLRARFNAAYAYEPFISEVLNARVKPKKQIVYKGITQIYQFLNELDKDKQYVLYGYGTVGKLIAPFLGKNVKGIIDESLSTAIDVNINILQPHDLTTEDEVIITAFKYAEEIIPQLQPYTQHIHVLYSED